GRPSRARDDQRDGRHDRGPHPQIGPVHRMHNGQGEHRRGGGRAGPAPERAVEESEHQGDPEGQGPAQRREPGRARVDRAGGGAGPGSGAGGGGGGGGRSGGRPATKCRAWSRIGRSAAGSVIPATVRPVSANQRAWFAPDQTAPGGPSSTSA